jgi:hypothetical protein
VPERKGVGGATVRSRAMGRSRDFMDGKAKYFSIPLSTIPPVAKRKVQRASHHCHRIISEIQQFLQPFSQELQEIFLREQQRDCSEVPEAHEKKRKRR